MATPPRILIAGLGNIFLGDDAFGVEVVRRLLHCPMPENVYVVDFGIRGSHLIFALLEDYDLVILVDAVARGGTPGTVYLIEPELPEPSGDPGDALLDPHNLDPASVLRLIAAMGKKFQRVLLVGCEPTPVDLTDLAGGLSAPVAAGVDHAADVIRKLVAEEMDAAMTPVEQGVEQGE
jgi:hydrogenase maturation protease